MPQGSVEEKLARAKYFLDKGKEEKALAAYRTIARDHAGTEWEEEARIGVARAYRGMKDYFAAVQEYQSFRRGFPRSPLACEAMYEIGLCYAAQRTNPEYDQEWNGKALRQFEDFISGCPESPLVEQARCELLKARTHKARKELMNGVTYAKLRRYPAARFYFQIVIDEYHDTSVVPEAMYELGRAYEGEKEAGLALQQYRELVERFPDSEFATRVRERAEKLDPKGRSGR